MNNKVGIYYAYWEQEWEADFTVYVRKASQIGFDVLEINAGAIADMPEGKRRDLAKVAKDAGIELTYCIGMPRMYDISSPDSGVRKTGLAYMNKMLQAIGSMEGKILGGILYGSWPSSFPKTLAEKKEWRDRSLDSMRKAASVAQNEGVICCLEVVNRYEQFIMNDAAEGLSYVRDLDCPCVKLLLDAYHMNIEEDSLREAIMASGEYIGHFHIGETNRRVPGRGHMPWDEIMDALRDTGYTGRIVMEPFLKPGGQVGSDIHVWRDLSQEQSFTNLDEEASFALRFVKSKLAERSIRA